MNIIIDEHAVYSAVFALPYIMDYYSISDDFLSLNRDNNLLLVTILKGDYIEGHAYDGSGVTWVEDGFASEQAHVHVIDFLYKDYWYSARGHDADELSKLIGRPNIFKELL